MEELPTQTEQELPRIAMVRELTDRTVLDNVFATRRITRVELARRTGISKPTISESVRRLTDAGVLIESGSSSGRPGRVATYYELAQAAGWVFAVQVSQERIRVRCVDLAGKPITSKLYPPAAAGEVDEVVRTLRTAVIEALASAGSAPLRAIAMSVANPVNPVTHQMIALPHSPFPEGHIDPRVIFGKLTDAPILLDNDVNLAAMAERALRGEATSNFAYLYAGGGLGLALCIGDHVIRGANGLAGEIGYLPDASRSGPTLADRFDHLGLMRPGTTTIDAPLVLAKLNGSKRLVGAVGDALASAVAATCAIVNPATVILGGPIGSHPAIVARVQARIGELTPLPVVVEATKLGDEAPLAGAVDLGVQYARKRLLATN